MKQFAICLGVFVILLLNVMELLSVVGVFYWIAHVWSSIECMFCACGPSERLDAPSICVVCVFVCRKLSYHFRAGSQVFALFMLFPCVIVYTMSLGKSLQLLCIFPFGMLCFSAISMMFKNYVGSVYISGYCGLSETGLCVFCELCPVSFLVVGEYPSVLL